MNAYPSTRTGWSCIGCVSGVFHHAWHSSSHAISIHILNIQGPSNRPSAIGWQCAWTTSTGVVDPWHLSMCPFASTQTILEAPSSALGPGLGVVGFKQLATQSIAKWVLGRRCFCVHTASPRRDPGTCCNCAVRTGPCCNCAEDLAVLNMPLQDIRTITIPTSASFIRHHHRPSCIPIE